MDQTFLSSMNFLTRPANLVALSSELGSCSTDPGLTLLAPEAEGRRYLTILLRVNPLYVRFGLSACSLDLLLAPLGILIIILLSSILFTR